MTTWTQDNTAVSYPLNPRVTETNVYDPEGNRARTQTTYQQFTYAMAPVATCRVMLQHNPESMGYIIVYAGRRACVGEAKDRALP